MISTKRSNSFIQKSFSHVKTPDLYQTKTTHKTEKLFETQGNPSLTLPKRRGNSCFCSLPKGEGIVAVSLSTFSSFQTPIWESNSQNKLYLFFQDYLGLIYSEPKRNLGRRNLHPSEDSSLPEGLILINLLSNNKQFTYRNTIN